MTTMRERTPATGLSAWAAAGRSATTAPDLTDQGTAVPSAGPSAPVAFGARVNALRGLPPRGAPV